MAVNDIFNKLFTHMLEGIQFHYDMAQAYDYLSLKGLSRCHVYHAYEEQQGYLLLSHYFLNHFYKLLQIENPLKQKVIPDTWYKYSIQSVDNATRRSATKELMERWIKWEQDTKQLYSEMRQELIQIGEVAAALYIDQYILDVTQELENAQKKLIRLETVGYDLVEMINWQEHLYKKYTKKLRW